MRLIFAAVFVAGLALSGFTILIARDYFAAQTAATDTPRIP